MVQFTMTIDDVDWDRKVALGKETHREVYLSGLAALEKEKAKADKKSKAKG
jgi:hypothetical protein